ARLTLAVMLLGAIGLFTLTAGAQPGAAQPDDTKKIREDAALRELVLSRQFAEFEQSLLKLIQKLKRGTDDDKKRAVALEKALDFSRDKGVQVQFDLLVQQLKDSAKSGLIEADIAAKRAGDIHDMLREILARVREDPNQVGRHERINDLKDMV